jgi:hypothetical protein
MITPPADAIVYNGGAYTPTGPPGQPDPNIESWQAQWQTIPLQSVVTATFTVRVDPNALTDTTFILNQAQVRAANLLKITLSRDIDVPGAPGTITCVNTPTPTATATSTPTDTATPLPTTTPPPTATTQTDTATPLPTATTQINTATPPSFLATPSPTSTPEFPTMLPETGGMLDHEPENVFLK